MCAGDTDSECDLDSMWSVINRAPRVDIPAQGIVGGLQDGSPALHRCPTSAAHYVRVRLVFTCACSLTCSPVEVQERLGSSGGSSA